jgi:1-deoxy-D-xylulose-5-phosphate synthase
VGKDLQSLPFGRGELRRQGKGLVMLAFGALLYPALEVAEKLNLTVVNMRWAKPLDEELLLQVAREHEGLITLEEGCVAGGAGSAVMEALQLHRINKPVLVLGIADQFTEHGDPSKLMAMQGLDAKGIEAQILERFGPLQAN